MLPTYQRKTLVCLVIMFLVVASSEKQDDNPRLPSQFQDEEGDSESQDDASSIGHIDKYNLEVTLKDGFSESNGESQQESHADKKSSKKKAQGEKQKKGSGKKKKTKKVRTTLETTTETQEWPLTSDTTVLDILEEQPLVFKPTDIAITFFLEANKTQEGEVKTLTVFLSLRNDNKTISTVGPTTNATNTSSTVSVPTTTLHPPIEYLEVSEGGNLTVTSDNEFRMTIVNHSHWVSAQDIAEGVNLTVQLEAHNVGHVHLVFLWRTCPQNDPCQVDDTPERHKELHILYVPVLRPPSVFDVIFFWTLTMMVMFNVFMMGTLLDIEILKSVLLKPLGPAVGFLSQFLFMPLASWGIGWLLLTEMDLRLGLFCLGCCPGGSQSNLWTLLFNGDMNLSMVMTFISSLAAVGMMPFWFYTLGRTLTSDTLVVPFLKLIISLILFTIPVGIGILVAQKLPKVAEKLEVIVKPITVISICIMFSLGVYANRYIFNLLTWQIVVSGVAVAGGGYAFGALMALVFRLKKPQIIAVSIETAFQNAGIAFLILQVSLSQPGGDLAGVPSISQLIITSIPLYIFLAGYLAFRKIRVKKKTGMQQRVNVGRADSDAQRTIVQDFTLNEYKGGILKKPAMYGQDLNPSVTVPLMLNQYSAYQNGSQKLASFPVCPSPKTAERLSSM